MAERNEQVMEMVAKALEEDPDVKAEVLYERAREIDAGIGDLSLRQFHARYPLPVKRKRGAARKGATRKRKKAARGSQRSAASAPGSPGGKRGAKQRDANPRDAVRRIFLDFASELARAESRAAIVDVLGSVDDYVDRVLDRAAR